MALIINMRNFHVGNYIPPNGLLEERDMEDIVDLAPLRKLQLICYPTDAFLHPVWPIEMGLELLISLLLECGLFVRLKKYIYKISHLKLSLYLTPLCIHLLLVLGSSNVVLECPEYVLVLLNPFLFPWSLTCPKNYISK